MASDLRHKQHMPASHRSGFFQGNKSASEAVVASSVVGELCSVVGEVCAAMWWQEPLSGPQTLTDSQVSGANLG